jgi:hypothetical protein
MRTLAITRPMQLLPKASALGRVGRMLLLGIELPSGRFFCNLMLCKRFLSKTMQQEGGFCSENFSLLDLKELLFAWAPVLAVAKRCGAWIHTR